MTHSQKGAIGTPLVIGGIIIILVLAGAYFINTRARIESPDAMIEDKEDTMMEKNDDAMTPPQNNTMTEEKEDAMMKENSEAMQEGTNNTTYKGELLAGSTAPLLVFNQADYDQAISEDKLVVLYFYANWCPTCKAEFPLAEAAFNQLKSDQVVGFRVNFNDNQTSADEKEMARKFGVPYQHTKVFVKNGTQILKSPEQWTKTRYLDEINNNI